VKRHLGLGIILPTETNGVLVPHDPRSRPKRHAHAFVFAIIAVTALAIIIAQVIAALTIAAAIVLRDQDNILGHRRWDHRLSHWQDFRTNLIAHPLP
jgi:hypothetical protein